MDFRKYLINLVLQRTGISKLEAYTKTNFELQQLLSRVTPI